MSYTRPDNTVSIQALANTCGVSRSTILRMENEGLLNPAYIDPDSGYRYYSTGNLAQVVRILNYQSLGFTKKEISEFLTDPDILRKNIDRLNIIWYNYVNFYIIHIFSTRKCYKKTSTKGGGTVC